jgi:beta-lactamase superfamily II metal-dependent hydrolase
MPGVKRIVRAAFTAAAAAILAVGAAGAQGRKSLEVYFVDVEGGQATLVVSPSGESMLIDAGFPGARDGERIAAAARDAGLSQIDVFLNTHFHADHFGSMPDLVTRIPVRTFVDHGETVETGERAQASFRTYTAVRDRGRHVVVKAGDRVPIKGLDVQVVIASGSVAGATRAGTGRENPYCKGAELRAVDPTEDASSVGTVIRYGKFRMIDLGDLTWNKEMLLACPNSLVGPVDVYVSTRHGLNGAGLPALVHALRPRVTIINNGADKGASREHFLTIRSVPGLEAIWQIHYSQPRAATAQLGETGDQGGPSLNTAEAHIANLDTTTAHLLRLSADEDGSFTVMNPRQGYKKRYVAR